MPNEALRQITVSNTCTSEGGVISITDYRLGTSQLLKVQVIGLDNGAVYEVFFPDEPLPVNIPVVNGLYEAKATDELGRSVTVVTNGIPGGADIWVDCLPANQGSTLALELETENPTTIGGTEGSVTFLISGGTGPYKTRIGVLELETGKVFYDGLSAGTYLAYVEDSTGAMVQMPFTLAGPAPVYHTEPQAKYLAVGGVLPNEINYHFNFNMFDEMGVLKESHYVQLDIYREDETAPFATTRARLKDALATVDISRYVRNIVKIVPPPVNGLVSPDYSAMKRFHVKYQEYANGAAVGQEVTTEEKYAVNAALQDLVNNNYENFVIFE